MLLARFVLCLAPVALAADAFAAVPPAPVTAALTFGSAPAVVGLVNVPGMVFCSGALIAPRLVLTAAHCLVQDGVLRWPHAVYAGADVRLGGAYLRVQGGEVHPAFDPFLHTADLAVLRLADVEDALTPLTIARSAPALHEPVRLVGFGASDEGPAGRQHTHTGAVINLARDFFRFAPGTCQGDSGGPVLATAPGKQGIAGVVSMSDASCTTGRGVSLADYAPWLTTTTARLDPPACRSGDGRCGAGCSLGDTDCPCREDGACQLCAGADPDCSDSCVSDGVCVAECLAPDPDCHTGVDGAMCTSDAECESAFCASGRCRSRCGGDGGGVTCAPWQRCAPLDGGSGGACVAIAAPPAGCAVAGATSSIFAPRGASSLLALLVAVAAALSARARRPSVFRPKQSTPNAHVTKLRRIVMYQVRSKTTQWISVITLGVFTSGAIGCDPAPEGNAVDHGQREFTAELLAYGEDEAGKPELQPLTEETFTLGEHPWLDREIVVDGRPTLDINEMFSATEIVVPLNDGGTLTLRRNGHVFQSQTLARPDSSESLELRAFALKEDSFELFRSDNADDSRPNAVMRIKGLDDLADVRRTLIATLALGSLLATIEEGENVVPAVAVALIAARVALWWFKACSRAVTTCAVRCARSSGFEVKCGALKVILKNSKVTIRPTFGLGCKCL